MTFEILLPAGSFAVAMTTRTAPEHTVVAGFHSVSGRRAECRESHSHQFTHGSGAGRHAVLKPEVVDSRQFIRREHDLQALGAEIVHFCGLQ